MEARTAGRILLRLPWLALIASLVCGVPFRAAAGTDAGAEAVRAVQARGERLLARGAALSGTFKRLVDQIRQSDIVVYVDLDPYDDRTLDRTLDGALQFVGKAGDRRYVRVWLRPRRTDDAIIVTLGHELHHAVEVARAPQITSRASLARFYETAGFSRIQAGSKRERPRTVRYGFAWSWSDGPRFENGNSLRNRSADSRWRCRSSRKCR